MASEAGLWDVASGEFRVGLGGDEARLIGFVDEGKQVLVVERDRVCWRDARSGGERVVKRGSIASWCGGAVGGRGNAGVVGGG